jgi:hypothetical protein
MRNEKEFALRTWLWDFLMEHVGSEEWYYGLLDRDSWDGFEVPLNSSEQDGAEMLQDIVDALASLLGSQHAAGRWLCHAKAFQEASACSPVDHLKSGEFDALCLLRDFMLVAKANPDDPLGFRLESA